MWDQTSVSAISSAQPKSFYKNNSKKTCKNPKNETDFDEELPKNLQEAFKKYKKNVKKKPAQVQKSIVQFKQSQPRSDIIESSNTCFNKSEYFHTEVNDLDFLQNDDAASLDLQELVNYFFSKEVKNEKGPEKTYVDYEKQGAIPKNKALRIPSNCNKLNSKTENTKANFNFNQTRNDQEKIHVDSPNGQRKRIKSSVSVAKVSQTDLVHCNFTTDFYNGNEILTLNEEICKKPFFYIVPNNPFSNFFFSPGSYYVTPQTPGSVMKDVVIFHPENEASKKGNLKNTILSLKNESEFQRCHNRNNLGKDTFQKTDSHLNIGPLDSKIDDFFRNLETSCEVNKVYEKDLLDSKPLKPPQKTKSWSNIIAEVEEDNLIENYELRTKTNTALLDVNEENSDSYESITCKEFGHDYEKREKNENKEKLDSVMQRLMSEFPNFDGRFACEIAKKYLNNEHGLKKFIYSENLKIKKQQQLERMILALPESNYEELQEKCEEFEGNEELVTEYITETQRSNQSQQLFVELQLLFPDADPDFLREKLEDWKDLNLDEAVSRLTNELLDDKTYPKISYKNVNKGKKLWHLYVEKFDFKNFILEVPNAQILFDKIENPANEKLIIKFLLLRYPDSSQKYLTKILQSNNYNLTRVCELLSSKFDQVNLSQNAFLNLDFDENFLKAVVYIDHRKEIDDYLKLLEERKQIETEEARINDSFLSCPLCCDTELIVSQAFHCPDGHIFCKDCIKSYISVKVGDGVYKFACPSDQCDTFFSYEALGEFIPSTILSRAVRKQQVEEVNTAKVDGLEFCPHCDFAYIPNAEDKIFICQNPMCLSQTCRKCGEENHIPLRCEEIERQIDVEARKKIEETMSNQLIRCCPNCFKRFVKQDGCNKMSCSCGTLICYVCRQQIMDYTHFSKFPGDLKCPLYSKNKDLHIGAVQKAGIQARDEILQENPNIRISFDPTKMESTI